jgi:hypothetical protein
MSDDTRDCIDQLQDKCKAYMGRELSPDELSVEFAKWKIDDRVGMIEELDKAGSRAMSVSQATKMHQYGTPLRNVHEALRKAGR